jgi:two-component system response regulator MprA
VDDDRAIRELLQFALECEGYEVTAFRDGAEILAHLACEADPSVILLDVMMPRLDGWEVCRRLAADPDLLQGHSVILMTAGLLPQEMLAPMPVTAVLLKPFNLEELYTVVARLTCGPAVATKSQLPFAAEALLAS